MTSLTRRKAMATEQEILALRKDILESLEETSDNGYYCNHCEILIFEERNLKDGEWNMDNEGTMYGADPFQDGIPIERALHAEDCPFYARQVAAGLGRTDCSQPQATKVASPLPTLHVITQEEYDDRRIVAIYAGVCGRDFDADFGEVDRRISERRNTIMAARYQPNLSIPRREVRREDSKKEKILSQAWMDAKREVLEEMGLSRACDYNLEYLESLGYKMLAWDEKSIGD
jgi:hypothetical protein